MLSSSLLLLAIVLAALTAGAARAASPVLLGDQNVESGLDSNSPGQAEAFPFVASSSGTAAAASVFIDSQNSASTVSVGLYTDSGGQPSSLLTTGSTSSPAPGIWNSIPLGPASIVAGDTYWITVLGVGGTIYFHDNGSSTCPSSTSAQTNLSSLPQSWTSGTSWPTCALSAYVTGTTSSPTPPSAPTNTAPPGIAGTPLQGDTLTTSDGSWTNSPASFAYQWQDCDASGLNCSDIPGATSPSYTLTGGDVGSTVVSVVTAANAGGASAQASSPTTVVAAQNSQGTPPTAPTNVTASAADSTQADLTWTAGVSGNGAGYTIYRDGVTIGTTSGTTYTDTAVAPGATYEYTVSAYDGAGNASAQTAPITVIVPSAGSKTIFADNFTGKSLSSAWTVISRHGEYAQAETECNVPQEVSVSNNVLDIATVAQNTTCGDFNLDGTVRHAPSVWPYATGDVQWTNFNFTYGTLSYRAKFPPQDTGTWPAVWMLGSNCQATNIVTADTGYDTCPTLWTRPYAEVDTTECDLGNWCQLGVAGPTSWPLCAYPVDNNWHTFSVTWTPTAISISVDGNPTGCSITSAAGDFIPSTPMFLIIQTQTGGSGGTPIDANLPGHLDVSDVTVMQP